MPVHFAAAFPSHIPAIGWLRASRLPLNAANDNGSGVGGERLLKAALRHFSQYGLGAAERARDNAEAAFFAGGWPSAPRWIAGCRLPWHSTKARRPHGRVKLTPNLTMALTNR
jgi:hypothetical protein